MTLFVVIAALMLAVALACVLVPLLRNETSVGNPAALARQRLRILDEARANELLTTQEYASKREVLAQELLNAVTPQPLVRSRSTFIAVMAVALLLPASAIWLYRVLGQPLALDADAIATMNKAQGDAPETSGAEIQQAIEGLATKLQQHPDDAESWTLLGRAYKTTTQFAPARDALKHAMDLQPGQSDVMIEYAEALALASDSRNIDGEPRVLIERALKLDPQNQRGLWLLGIGDYQQGKFTSAIQTWNVLLTQLPKDSDVAQSVQQQIHEAELQLSGNALAAAESVAGNQKAPTSAPAATKAPDVSKNETSVMAKLTVHVVLDAKFKDTLAPDAVLFVYAKAVSGPPMPLAIQRLQASQLPLTLTLDDSMGMLPSMKLSQFPQVVVGARISKSGNAIAQSGDLQTVSNAVAVTGAATIELNIDQVVP